MQSRKSLFKYYWNTSHECFQNKYYNLNRIYFEKVAEIYDESWQICDDEVL